MTNPFQHGSSGFGDSFSASGMPTSPPIGQRRPSYASIVSSGTGLPGLARVPSRTGPFSNILNPPMDESSYGGGSSLYSTGRSHQYHHHHHPIWHASGDSAPGGAGSFGGGSSGLERNGGASGQDAMAHSTASASSWQHFGTSVPLYSSAFEQLLSPDYLRLSDDSDKRNTRTPNISSTGFLSPSYLRGSIYLQKLEEAHKARVRAQRDGHGAQASGAGGSHQYPPHHYAHNGVASGHGSSALHTSSSKLPAGSHRGVSFELVEKTTTSEEEDGLSPLPSRWNKDDKYGGLEVIGDGYEVKYTGHKSASDRDHESCAIRADRYMPTQCGVYYFEVMILTRKREDSTPISIGFASRTVPLSRAPGWEPDSWGYHGDDGHVFTAHNQGKTYGPMFAPGDVIGCLVNFRLGHALFTKNGMELSIAFRDVNFKDVKGKLYPTVGLKRPGDHIMVNFGQTPFMYDIDGYMEKQRKMVFENIAEADTSMLAPPLGETELIQQLVLQFLQHDGYVETARAFAEEIYNEKKALNLDEEEVEGVNIKDDEDANNRQRIRSAVLEGDIDRALKFTDAYYPHVLKDNEQVYFRLRCRKFIEMIRKEAELNQLAEKKGSKRYSSALEDDEEMTEADENSNWGEEMDTEDGMDGDAGISKLMQEAVLYGQELRSEFANDPRIEVSKYLDEIFALIAYQNPLSVPEMRHLLDRAGRVAVAEELNSAILRSFGKSSRAALENLYAQTAVLLEDLRKDGGDGAFVTLEKIIDDIPEPENKLL